MEFSIIGTVYPKKYAHGFCFAVLCCGYTLTDFPISIRLTSLALWQSNDCPSASKATLMNMDKYFMWIHYERLHNHNKAKHNKTVCIFLGIYCNSTECCHVSTLICSICKAKSRIFCHIHHPCLSKFTHLQNRGTGGTHKVSSFSLSYWNIDSTLHCSYLKSTVQCSYNAIQYIMIFHTLLHWLTQDINTTFN